MSTCSGNGVDSCPAEDAIPRQIHIALAGSLAMRVQWYTAKSVAASVVEFGTSTSSLGLNATGTARQYLANFGWHHAALLEGLSPGATYYYRVGDGESAWGAVHSFRVPAGLADVSAGTVSLAVFGDMGYQNSTVRPMSIAVDGLEKQWSASHTYELLREQVDQQAIDAVWHLGDVGYMDDAYAHGVGSFGYERAYNGYMEWLEPIASKVAYMVTPGNHESECHSPACLAGLQSWGVPLANFSAFNGRWAMPHAESGGTSNMWYSFDLGAAHFVSLDSETDWEGAEEEGTGDSHLPQLPAGSFGRAGEYLAWLEADLQRAAAAREAGGPRWILAGSHRPFKQIEATHGELLRKYGVDAYFAGHSHSYTRETHTFGADNSTLLTIVAGGAGCDEMRQAPKTNESGVGLRSFHTARYASGVLRLNATALHWQLIDSEDRSLLDEAILTRAS